MVTCVSKSGKNMDIDVLIELGINYEKKSIFYQEL